jgi:hypothetical protein
MAAEEFGEARGEMKKKSPSLRAYFRHHKKGREAVEIGQQLKGSLRRYGYDRDDFYMDDVDELAMVSPRVQSHSRNIAASTGRRRAQGGSIRGTQPTTITSRHASTHQQRTKAMRPPAGVGATFPKQKLRDMDVKFYDDDYAEGELGMLFNGFDNDVDYKLPSALRTKEPRDVMGAYGAHKIRAHRAGKFAASELAAGSASGHFREKDRGIMHRGMKQQAERIRGSVPPYRADDIDEEQAQRTTWRRNKSEPEMEARIPIDKSRTQSLDQMIAANYDELAAGIPMMAPSAGGGQVEDLAGSGDVNW